MVIGLPSCKKPFTADNLPITRITFGEGGGFTGAVTEYCLLENGQLFSKTHFTNPFSAFKKIKKKRAKALFNDLNNLNIDNLTLSSPGDKYYFIGYETPKGIDKITWGAPDVTVPAGVAELYNGLRNIVLNKPKNWESNRTRIYSVDRRLTGSKGAILNKL